MQEAGQALTNVRLDADLAERIRKRYARLFPPTLDLTDSAVPLSLAEATLLGPDDIQRATTSSGISSEFRGYALDTLAAEIQGVLVNADSRVRDPIYHVVLSWPAHERPTDEQAFACARHAIAALGMADHQYLSAVHRDTDNTHVHIAVNRVHPESYRAVYPKQDFFVLDRAMRELELEYGWSHDPGPYVVLERDGVPVIERSRAKASTQEKMPSAAADLERFTGESSFFTYVREAPRADILALWKTSSPTWTDLHEVLAQHGLALRPKGQGFAVYDSQNEDTPPLKASDMHESLSRARLERRLGPWTQPTPTTDDDASRPRHGQYDRRRELKRDPAQREARRQERADARRQLRADYQAYRAAFVIRKVSGDESRARYRAIVDAARARRREVLLTVADSRQRKALYSVIAFETLTAREILKADLAERRAALRANPHNRPLTYREWVEAQAAAGSAGAISQLRGWAYADTRRQAEARRQLPGIAAPSTEHDPIHPGALPDWQLAVHRDGRISYRNQIGAERFVDHGEQILVSADGASDSGVILAALRLAQNKYQGRFILTGTLEFQQQVLQLIAKEKLDVTLLDADQSQRLVEIRRDRSATRSPLKPSS